MPSLGFFLFSGWVVSGVSMIWLIDRACECDDEEDDEFQRILDDAERRQVVSATYLWFVKWFAIGATKALLFLFSPLLWPCGLVWATWETWRDSRERHLLVNTHREYLFAWRRVDELPSEVRQLFDEHQSEFERLDFACVGNYLMKELPKGYYGRLFLSDDSATIGSTIRMTDREYVSGVSFSTLLADGTVIETAMTKPFPELALLNGQDGYLSNVIDPESSFDEACASHQETVAEACRSHTTKPLLLSRGQVTDALRYEGRRYSQIMHEHGRLKEPPPPAELPTAADSAANFLEPEA